MTYPFEMIAVLDFEATCADDRVDVSWKAGEQEIIEFPVAVISVAERRVVARYHRLVRPTRQPRLTAFCAALTSIKQHEVDAAQPIDVVVRSFGEWAGAEGLSPENTCVATCGDWDLRRMWPLQVSLVPGLQTPALFRCWCNLKRPFEAQAGVRAGGMSSMLRHLGLPLVGVHHRGADDVQNLCSIVVQLLERGSIIAPTWGEPERAQEHQSLSKKLDDAREKVRSVQASLDRIPATAPPAARASLAHRLEEARDSHDKLARFIDVFSGC